MRSMIYGVAVAVTICMSPAHTWAVECPDTISEGMPKVQFFACLVHMQQEIRRLRGGPTIPAGAVVAFDRPDGCPEDGWTAFTGGAGRFIIGVDGTAYKLPYVAGKPEYQTGGEEKVTLTGEQMPPHIHSIDLRRDNYAKANHQSALMNVNGVSGSFRGAENAKKPHNNMPPYIALYFCKKD